MPYRTDTFRIAMAGPADLSGLTALIEDGALEPTEIVAILVKTEGNGGVNDFTREYTCTTIAATLAPYLRATNAEVERRIAMVVSGGTEGVLSPHATIFARVPVPAGRTNGQAPTATGTASGSPSASRRRGTSCPTRSDARRRSKRPRKPSRRRCRMPGFRASRTCIGSR